MSKSPRSPDDPLAQFAANLRQLRHDAEDISYRRLAERANVSPSALSQAASGRKLPTWNVTRAFVKGCDGDEESWYEQWSQVRRELNTRQDNIITNGQLLASTPGGKAPEAAPHDTGSRQRSVLVVPAGGPRSPHPATPRVVLLLAVIAVVLLAGGITINSVYDQEGARPTVPEGGVSASSPPMIPTYINNEYQGVAGLYETPRPPLEVVGNPPYTVGPSVKLKIVCQVPNGSIMRADLVNAATGVPRDEENDVWYRVLPSNYYVPAVYTIDPFGVDGRPVPDQPFGVTIPECKDVPY